MRCFVKDLMIPLSEYLTVDSERTLQEAVMTLQRARNDRRGSSHSDNILAIDQDRRVVGKLSPLDMIKGLEDGYQKVGEIKAVDH
jgi:CBS domain-containing protein